jgi:hypothetical protein
MNHHSLLDEVYKEVLNNKNFSMYRGLIRRAVPFALDTASTRLVTELASNPDKVGLYRALARLPYDAVWLEYDYREKVNTQIKIGTRNNPYDVDAEPNKMGYLIERLNPTRWRAVAWVSMKVSEKNKSVHNVLNRLNLRPGTEVIETMPPMFILDTEGTISGYKTLTRDASLHHAVQHIIDHDEAPCAIAWGLNMNRDTHEFVLTPSLRKTVCVDLPPDWEALLMRDTQTPHRRRDLLNIVLPATTKEQSGMMRFLCAALASITSAPTILVDRKQPGSFRADGRLRDYRVNTVVTLHVPGKRTITVKHLLAQFSGARRRMARHQVHGFWRTTVAVDCPSERWQWLYSQRHREMRWHIWINDFERGDASLGYVLRNYEVTT